MSALKRLVKHRIFAILMIVIFLVIECFVLSSAKFRYDHEQSRYIAEELSIKLSLISLSLQSGDKAAYTQAVTDYRSTLSEFSKNNYVVTRANDLLRRLKSYSGTLMEDSEYISKLMELRVAIATISAISVAAQTEEIDAIKVYDIAQNYVNFRNGLEGLDDPKLSDLLAKITAMSNEIIQVAEKSAVCISICPDESLAEKQKTVDDIVARYKEDLSELGIAVSEKYNPNQLILDLNNYSKL